MSLGRLLFSMSRDEKYIEKPEVISEKVWKAIKKTLEEFASTNADKGGFSIFFDNVSEVIIEELKHLAYKEDIRLEYWRYGSAWHPNLIDEDIGVLTWDKDTFNFRYPLNISVDIMVVKLGENDEVTVKMRGLKEFMDSKK